MTAAFLIRQGIAQEKHHGPQDNDDALGQKILGIWRVQHIPDIGGNEGHPSPDPKQCSLWSHQLTEVCTRSASLHSDCFGLNQQRGPGVRPPGRIKEMVFTLR